MKKFSDTSPVSMSDTSKVLAEGATTDQFAHILGSALFTYLNTTKTLLTQAEVLALSELIQESTFTNNSSLMWKNESGIVENIIASALETAHPDYLWSGFGLTVDADIDIAAGLAKDIVFSAMNKTWAIFSKGTGNGCLNSASLVDDKYYFIFLISEDATDDLDIFVDVDETGGNIPSGWTNEKILGSFVTDDTPQVQSDSVVEVKEYDMFGFSGNPYPRGYVSSISWEWVSATEITIDECFARDQSNSVNIKHYSSSSFQYTGLEGDSTYYIYLVYNVEGGFLRYYPYKDGETPIDDYYVKIGTLKTDSSANYIESSILFITNDLKEKVVVDYDRNLIPYASVDKCFLEGYYKEVATAQTAAYSTTFRGNNQNLVIKINSITLAGTCTITGTKVNKDTNGFTSTTEDIAITTTPQSYCSVNRWAEITDISFTDATGYNYDIELLGMSKNLYREFEILGYNADVIPIASPTNPDVGLVIEKLSYDVSTNILTVTTLEDIEIDSDAAGNQIIDNTSRTVTRTLSPTVSSIIGGQESFNLNYIDFKDVFSVGDNIVNGELNEGYRIYVKGGGTSSITDIENLRLSLYLELKKILS